MSKFAALNLNVELTDQESSDFLAGLTLPATRAEHEERSPAETPVAPREQEYERMLKALLGMDDNEIARLSSAGII